MTANRPLPLAVFAIAALSPLPLLGFGLWAGGGSLWLAFLYMALLTILLDQIIPLTAGAADGAEFPAADALLAVIAVGHFATLPLATWAIAADSGLGTGQRILVFLSAGFWFGQVAHPAAHELIHRPSRGLFRLGVAIYTSLLFGQHASAHRLVHHRHVASTLDPNSARANESFYRFARRAWRGSFRQGWQAETDLRARSVSHSPHPYAVYLFGGALCLAIGWLIAGVGGALVWAGLALHAQSQILLSDYVQHYGLTRALQPDGRPEPVGPRHSWNTAHWFSSAMMLNAPRHSDHHAHPARPFPALRLPPEDIAPRLPWPLPLACVMALFPALWRRSLQPHLARWNADLKAQDTAT
ncbi:alkane 1-monooxygenase [Tabrizicola sp.]|uniref:alkane 1-monooxygenase n=1 Tax=Tabrizicola sp. TaxID=2005166 RepID=UPI00286C94AA|nr:alkane 1-monooxygenase [Tabrizicola sp.]